MTDLALVADETGLNTFMVDMAIADNDLVTDDGLETAVILSLFVDRRAADEDVLPPGMTDRRGWFGDAVPIVAGDKSGSRLWMLMREKLTTETVTKAREFAEEALAWMVDDLVAEEVTVETSNPAPGLLAIAIDVKKPGTDPIRFAYNLTWAAQKLRRG